MQLPYTGPPRTPAAQPRRAHTPAPGRTDGKGLDLAVHYADVRATVMSACSLSCEARGIDPEDLISAVYESILASNGRPSAYDPARASLSRYLRTLAISRLLHLVDKIQRRTRAEQLGVRSSAGVDVDAADAAVDGGRCPNVLFAVARLLPTMVAQARADDARAQRHALATAHPETGAEQGWREQAVQWVVLDSPSSAAAAGWWRCTVCEANARLMWARAAWEDAIEEMSARGAPATPVAAPAAMCASVAA